MTTTALARCIDANRKRSFRKLPSRWAAVGAHWIDGPAPPSSSGHPMGSPWSRHVSRSHGGADSKRVPNTPIGRLAPARTRTRPRGRSRDEAARVVGGLRRGESDDRVTEFMERSICTGGITTLAERLDVARIASRPEWALRICNAAPECALISLAGTDGPVRATRPAATSAGRCARRLRGGGARAPRGCRAPTHRGTGAGDGGAATHRAGVSGAGHGRAPRRPPSVA